MTAKTYKSSGAKSHKFSVYATPFSPANQLYDPHADAAPMGHMYSSLSAKASLFTPAETDSYAFLAPASTLYGSVHSNSSHKASMQLMPMAHPNGIQPHADSIINQYSGAPIMRLPYQREAGLYDGHSWNAAADSTLGRRKVSKLVATNVTLWVPVEAQGRKGYAPALLFPRDVSISPFEHMYCVHPRNEIEVELELYLYLCSRCSLKTLYGRLSSRKADLVVSSIAQDIPPISIAHLIEQITTAKVVALIVSDTATYQIEMWIDRPNQAAQVVTTLECGLWTCPMFHGYAVYCKNEGSKRYMESYFEKLRRLPEYEHSIYPIVFAEVHEPSA